MPGGSSNHCAVFAVWSSCAEGSRARFVNFISLLSDRVNGCVSTFVPRFIAGMLVLAAWGGHGWLPSGHAMRMALDLGLHHALEKLANNNGKQRTEEEERDLGMAFPP
jgi:hypothetical protein